MCILWVAQQLRQKLSLIGMDYLSPERPWQGQERKLTLPYLPAHLSSCSVNQGHGGSEQGALMLTQLEWSFPPCWTWTRWITWTEKMGQICLRPSGRELQPHGWHYAALLIWKACSDAPKQLGPETVAQGSRGWLVVFSNKKPQSSPFPQLISVHT